ncbi:cytochrome-450 hydroxylase [Hysterangium stoloniferum]|nr:cytochrome-450 hydroxylase [Hysterangium stoloniferum]
MAVVVYILTIGISLVPLLLLYVAYIVLIEPRLSPIHYLPGPPVSRWLTSHLSLILDPSKSAREVEELVQKYGRTFRIVGMGPHDERLMTIDPTAISHVLGRSIYEKPWQSRRLISRLIGEGLLSSEGNMHKRQAGFSEPGILLDVKAYRTFCQRKVSNPAFSQQNLRELLPIFFQKAEELRCTWLKLADPKGTKIDVCHWLGRATFDIIGLAGFDYAFDAIQDETNEIYLAYRDMFDAALNRGQDWTTVAGVYFPIFNKYWRSEKNCVIENSLAVIQRAGTRLVQEKKKALAEGAKTKDLLGLMLMSNLSTEIPIDQRISDEDIFNQISTFLFAGSDTSSLSLTWTLYLLAKHPEVQSKVREELKSVRAKLSESWIVLYRALDALPVLDGVVRESLRFIPPIHSSLRVATRDDEIPLSEPVTMRDGSKKWSIGIRKGQFVHVAMRDFNLDRGAWGETGWEFDPNRWSSLSEKAKQQPGLYPNIMTFSAGPRGCIGMTFALMEIKIILYTLITSFVFSDPENIIQVNAVLIRPFVRGKSNKGSQCPITVTPC